MYACSHQPSDIAFYYSSVFPISIPTIIFNIYADAVPFHVMTIHFRAKLYSCKHKSYIHKPSLSKAQVLCFTSGRQKRVQGRRHHQVYPSLFPFPALSPQLCTHILHSQIDRSENCDIEMNFSCPGPKVIPGGGSHAPNPHQLFQTCWSRKAGDGYKPSLSGVCSVVMLLQCSGAILVDGERHF